MKFLYWRWLSCSGSLSRLHRTHPTHSRITWCGALAYEGADSGIAEIFHTDTQPPRVEMCIDCVRLRKPFRVKGWESEEEDRDYGDENDARAAA